MRLPLVHASNDRAVAKWVFPVPTDPKKIKFSFLSRNSRFLVLSIFVVSGISILLVKVKSAKV